MERNVARVFLATVLTVFFSVIVVAQSVQYRVEDLGQLDGRGSFATGINQSGQVVGFLITDTHQERAVRSVEGLGFQYLPGLEATQSEGDAINASGTIAGWVEVSPWPYFAYHAMRYTDAGGVEDLGTLGGVSSSAYGINQSGVAAGWSYNSSGKPRAFRAAPGQPMQEVSTFAGPNASSFASSINDAGQIAGQAETSIGTYHAFRFTEGSGVLDLGTLGGVNSFATQINASGQVVGRSYTASALHAFRYSNGVGMEDLDTLGTSHSEAYALNDAGHVVGAYIQGGPARAFLYTDERGMVDLNSLIEPGSGWVLNAAYGINNDGHIVGAGTLNDQLTPRAFRLVPIQVDREPPTITSASSDPTRLWPPDLQMVPVQISVTATDNADPFPQCRVTAVGSSEPDEDVGSPHAGDFAITGDLSLELRAQRLGTGTGRDYAITIACTDRAGNQKEVVVHVSVPLDVIED